MLAENTITMAFLPLPSNKYMAMELRIQHTSDTFPSAAAESYLAPTPTIQNLAVPATFLPIRKD